MVDKRALKRSMAAALGKDYIRQIADRAKVHTNTVHRWFADESRGNDAIEQAVLHLLEERNSRLEKIRALAE